MNTYTPNPSPEFILDCWNTYRQLAVWPRLFEAAKSDILTDMAYMGRDLATAAHACYEQGMVREEGPEKYLAAGYEISVRVAAGTMPDPALGLVTGDRPAMGGLVVNVGGKIEAA